MAMLQDYTGLLKLLYIVQYEDRGEKRGLQKGIEQRNIEVAKQMLEKGLAIGTIESISGLSKQELEKIKKG